MTIGRTVKRLDKIAQRELAEVTKLVAWVREQASAGKAVHGIEGLFSALENAVLACPDKVSTLVEKLQPVAAQAVQEHERERMTGEGTRLYLIPVANALNVLELAGAEFEPSLRTAVLDWFRNTITEPRDPLPLYYWTTVFGALALDVDSRTPAVTRVEPGVTFESDLEGLANYLRDAIATNASFADVRAAWEDFVDYADALRDVDWANTGTVLWVARIVYHRIDGVPLGDVAQRFHDDLWKLAGKT